MIQFIVFFFLIVMWEVVENAADNIQGKKQFAKFTMSQIKEVVTFLAPNREGKLMNHFNQALTRFISTTRSQVRGFASHVT